jgi:N-acetylmuramoyl-L-alanine amidase
MRITINAGHCPRIDPGAIGQNGLQEADVVKEVATTVCDLLKYFGHEVQFVQSDSLEEICDLSNAWGSDLFVSIHCNGATNPQAHGTETWAYDGSGKSSYLARCVQDELVEATGLADRGVKQSSGLYVLKHTNCPACLVELAFITNLQEEELLASTEWKNKAAEAIVKGVQSYE